MADEEKKDEGAVPIPPKLDLTKNVDTGAANLGKGDTMQIQLPPDSGEGPTLKIRPAQPASPTAKKETSRIPLEAASDAPGEGVGKPVGAPKTIRIKPITKSFKPSQPTVTVADDATKLDDKRKTSRISLDAVFAAGEQEGAADEDSGRPKTIRLKRPSEAATIKVAKKPITAAASPAATSAAAPSATPPSEAKTVLSKTSRIDDVPEGEEEITPTRRKTIRVKRPTQSQPVKSLSVKRPGEEGDEDEYGEFGGDETQPVVIVDEPNFVFPLLAVAFVLIAFVTIYVLCAQAFGPNSSLSQLSYWPSGPDLAWPDKAVPILAGERGGSLGMPR